MVEYVEDHMCYGVTVGIYFSHRPDGGEWSELVRVDNISHVPDQIVEMAPGRFGVVYYDPSSHTFSFFQILSFNVDDLYDTSGPYRPT